MTKTNLLSLSGPLGSVHQWPGRQGFNPRSCHTKDSGEKKKKKKKLTIIYNTIIKIIKQTFKESLTKRK